MQISNQNSNNPIPNANEDENDTTISQICSNKKYYENKHENKHIYND